MKCGEFSKIDLRLIFWIFLFSKFKKNPRENPPRKSSPLNIKAKTTQMFSMAHFVRLSFYKLQKLIQTSYFSAYYTTAILLCKIYKIPKIIKYKTYKTNWFSVLFVSTLHYKDAIFSSVTLKKKLLFVIIFIVFYSWLESPGF